jgi:RNA recognition motif-containing protein
MEGKRLYVGQPDVLCEGRPAEGLILADGEVVSEKIIEQKGFGFVEMAPSEQAQGAMDALNQTVFEGRTMRIDEARPCSPSGVRPRIRWRWIQPEQGIQSVAAITNLPNFIFFIVM